MLCITLLISTNIISANILQKNKNLIFNVNDESDWTVMMYLACDATRDSLTDDFLQKLTNIGSNSNIRGF